MTALLRWAAVLSWALWGALNMPSDQLTAIGPEQFCITEGRIGRSAGDWMIVDTTKMRTVLGFVGKSEAELRFRYRGETTERSLLRSGAERTQLGLKLRAQDDCNVVYVMWRIDPISKLVVSVKSNPGQHRHSECGNSGYTNMKGSIEAPVPRLESGSEHSLRAALDETALAVYVDEALAWKGSVSREAAEFDGPVGLRSDNARFDFQLFAQTKSGSLTCDKNRTE